MSAEPVSLALYGAERVVADPHARAVGTYERFVKPAFDVVAALVLLVVAVPLFAGVALAVRMAMGPGVIYRQQRVGRNGRHFTIYKFRTMGQDRRAGRPAYTGPERRVCHKRDDDPRHTAVGRFLRRTSLDELPQLWNVVRQDMSLVGPRPELVSVVEKYQPWQHRRHWVRPGITGLWQVSRRGDVLMCEDSTADLEYLEKVSLRTDLGILVRTPIAVVGRAGS